MLSNIWNTIYPIIIAILFFELIIIVHEGGHFIAARMMGIRVNEFSIGMGPKVFQISGKQTKYTLRWILFGGYCQMEGESEDSDAPDSFAKKSVIRRIFVVVAGAVMNLVLGLIITSIMTCSGQLVGTTTIASFEDTAVSASVLKPGDTIKSIDGMRVFCPSDVTTGLSRSADGDIDMVIVRDGREMTVTPTFDMQEYDGHNYIKMDFWLYGVDKNVGNVIAASAKEWLSYARTVFLSLHDIIVGRFGLSDLSGPVGAVSVVSSAVKYGAYSMLRIMALLTINVGLFNLFPIPALDGWRLFLLIFEGLFKKSLPQKWEWAINSVGLVLLLGLMSVITFSDITKLFR